MDRLQFTVLILIQVSIASSNANTGTERPNCRTLVGSKTINVKLSSQPDASLVLPNLEACGLNDDKTIDLQSVKFGSSSFEATVQLGGFSVESFPVFIRRDKKGGTGTIKDSVKLAKFKLSVDTNEKRVSVTVNGAEFEDSLRSFPECRECNLSGKDKQLLQSKFKDYAKDKMTSWMKSFIEERVEALVAKRCKVSGTTPDQ